MSVLWSMGSGRVACWLLANTAEQRAGRHELRQLRFDPQPLACRPLAGGGRLTDFLAPVHAA